MLHLDHAKTQLQSEIDSYEGELKALQEKLAGHRRALQLAEQAAELLEHDRFGDAPMRAATMLFAAEAHARHGNTAYLRKAREHLLARAAEPFASSPAVVVAPEVA